MGGAFCNLVERVAGSGFFWGVDFLNCHGSFRWAHHFGVNEEENKRSFVGELQMNGEIKENRAQLQREKRRERLKGERATASFCILKPEG